jgi:hypothetical protein
MYYKAHAWAGGHVYMNASLPVFAVVREDLMRGGKAKGSTQLAVA